MARSIERAEEEGAAPGPFDPVHLTAGLSFTGLILPLIALGVELMTRMCSAIYMDPLPTLLHVPLIASGPAFWILSIAGSTTNGRRRVVAFLGGLAVVSNFAYALFFAPLMPVAAIGIVFLGIGLLPFAPLLACYRSVPASMRLHEEGGLARSMHAWGVAAGLLVVGWPLLTGAIGARLVNLAVSGSEDERERAVAELRTYGFLGPDEHVARAARTGVTPSLLGAYAPIEETAWVDRPRGTLSGREVDRAGEAYFRAFGRSAELTRPEPRRFWRDIESERPAELALDESSMILRVDAAHGYAYAEWTMSIENTSWRQLEAEFTLDLPPGGVVSRATLWVAGEPREASFASRRLATEAYEAVVRRAKDPLLVTETAPGRVSVRGFPVTSREPFRFRLGVTLPLIGGADGVLVARLPAMDDQNFHVEPGASVHVTAAGDAPFWIADEGAQESAPGEWTVGVHAGHGDGAGLRVHAVDAGTARASALFPGRFDVPEALVLVVPTDRTTGSRRGEVIELLEGWPGDVGLGIVLAGDLATRALPVGSMGDPEHRARALEVIEGATYRGGVCAGEALSMAAEVAGGAGAGILWLASPQPVDAEGDDEVPFALARSSPAGLAIHRLTVGGNRLAEGLLRGQASWPGRSVPVFELPGVSSSVSTVGGWLESRTSEVGWPWSPAASPPLDAGFESLGDAQKHLFRLAAAARVRELVKQGRDGREAALDLSLEARIVTAVSGAVILETDRMTLDAGLPLADGEVPTVPEPELIALIAMALAAAAGFAVMRR